MASDDREIRRLAATIAISHRLAQCGPGDKLAMNEAARAAVQRQFEDEVDPDRVLTEEDRAARVKALRSKRMAELSLLGVKARRAKAALAEVS